MRLECSSHAVRFLIAALVAGVSGCECTEASLRTVAPHLRVEPLAVDFGEVPVGDFRVRGLRLLNDGDLALEIRSTELTGSSELTVTVAAPATLEPQEAFELVLSYAPVDLGPDEGTLTLAADDAEGPRAITLRGVGVRGALTLLPPRASCEGIEGSVSFGEVEPGQTAEELITLENRGSGPLDLVAAEMAAGSSPEISVEPLPGPKTLLPGEQHTLRAHYRPVDGGPDHGTIEITTHDPESPVLRIPACGAGVGPALCARPVPLNLGTVAVGTTARGTLRLESCGLRPLELRAVALAMDAAHPTDARFALPSTPALPATLTPGQGIDVEVTFNADRLGGAAGFVQASSDAPGTPESYFPLAVNVSPPCALTVAPARLVYSGVAIGQSASKSVIVANDGAESCHLTRIEITPSGSAFALDPPATTPLDIAPGASVTLSVRYSPTIRQQALARLEVDEAGGTQQVELVGNPLDDQVCTLDVAPPSLSFGLVAVGQQKVLGVELRNLSQVLCTVRSVQLGAGTSPDFQSLSRALRLIPAGGRVTLEVAYRPTTAGAARGTLEASSNDPAAPTISVPLFASSAPSGICVVPPQIAFGTVPVGTVSEAEFRIYACGSNSVTVSALDWTSAAAEISLVSPPALPFTLAPGADRAVRVRYAPIDTGSDRGVVTVRSDDVTRPAIDVEITGAGFRAADAPVYIHTRTDLFGFDPATQQLTPIGSFTPGLGLANMVDIAIDLRGAMYAIDSNGQVYSVDPTSAAISPLFQYENGGAPGLTCLSSGKLVAAGLELAILDPVTGRVEQTVVGANIFETSGDVVALPDGKLYWTVTNGGSDSLVRVDPATGSATPLPTLPTRHVYGLGYAGGQLLGFAEGGAVLVLDPVTGAELSSSPLDGAWFGGTTNPVRW
ncbi:MAG: choice-of-anchor D domain-containing protein [Deltaproteobacteria bacterium]|nr:choice-of-anchor D domain-containing protein [Deltaproteobacteria bacterium]